MLRTHLLNGLTLLRGGLIRGSTTIRVGNCYAIIHRIFRNEERWEKPQLKQGCRDGGYSPRKKHIRYEVSELKNVQTLEDAHLAPINSSTSSEF